MDTSLQITGPVTTVDELVPLFEPDMRELCDLTRGMFDVERDDQGNVLVSEVEKIYAAELKVIAKRKQAREMVDAAKDDLQELARIAQQQKLAATRPASVPSAAEVESRLANAQASRVADMKSNVDAEQKLYRMQGQLEKLRAEIKLEDDQEVWDENELLSEVLRLKMYRGFGFTPVADDDGNYNKILVRSSKSNEAQSVTMDPKQDNFFYANILWDLLEK